MNLFLETYDFQLPDTTRELNRSEPKRTSSSIAMDQPSQNRGGGGDDGDG
jgi:hypothetical protein